MRGYVRKNVFRIALGLSEEERKELLSKETLTTALEVKVA